MIDPSSIKLDALPWLPMEEKASFPTISGIYLAIDSSGVVQYVGRSTNIRTRWTQHHRHDQLKAMGGVRIVYIALNEVELLADVETALIQYFQPLLNSSLIPRREDKTTRANFKLNTGVRKVLKNDAALNNRSESAQVERIVIKTESVKRILQKYPDIAAIFYPSLMKNCQKSQMN